MAECHPVGFQWVTEAKARGAKVDPHRPAVHPHQRDRRPARAAARGLRHRLPRRAGQPRPAATSSTSTSTCVAYTNAAAIVSEDFRDAEDLDGLFSGYDPEKRIYDQDVLAVRDRGAGDGIREDDPAGGAGAGATLAAGVGQARRPGRGRRLRRPAAAGQGRAGRDPAAPAVRLPDPQAPLRPVHAGDGRRGLRHRAGGLRARSPSGSPATAAATGRRRGSTRSAGRSTPSARSTSGRRPILQSLLGNMGRPGGGIMALRGHASIQGSTDIPTLFNLLPGYLPMPHAHQHESLDDYVRRRRRHRRFLGQQARLHGQPAQGLVGRRGDGGERLLLRLPAAGSTATTAQLPHGQRHDRGQGLGLLPGGGEPDGRARQRAHAALRPGQPRLARRPRPADDRVGHLLEGRPGDRYRRAGHRADRHRGLLHAGGHARGEGGHLHPDAAAAAVAAQGRRPAGRRAAATCGSTSTSAACCGSS